MKPLPPRNALLATALLALPFCTQTGSPPPQTLDGPSGQALRLGKAQPPAPPSFDQGVTLRLIRRAEGGEILSFGVPLRKGAVTDPAKVQVRDGSGSPLPARVDELLAEHDAAGKRIGVRAVLIQLPSQILKGPALDVRITYGTTPQATGPVPSTQPSPPAPSLPFLVPTRRAAFRSLAISADSDETAQVTTWTITQKPGRPTLAPGPITKRLLFPSREPLVLAHFPDGYLAYTGILGRQITADEAKRPALSGMRFLSEALPQFASSSLFEEEYPLTDDPESVPDPIKNPEGWLYDRCATLLLTHVHTGELRFLRAALRHCAYYASQVRKDGPNAGTFSGKPGDAKYSHLRGLYAYYALTGDEVALLAGRAIAAMWQDEPLFVRPYRKGRLRGPEKLWTERLLGTALEGLYYGHRLTGEGSYLQAFRELFETALRHISGDPKTLAEINPGVNMPPQGCFIHNGAQQGDGDLDKPWCSVWMSELLIDPLLRYEEQTGDRRVDQIFLRLGRYLRDVGTVYFHRDPLKDTFLAPSVCDDPHDEYDRRMLVPLYGVGIDAAGKRRIFGEWDDFLHCADATALTAVALRALRRQGGYDKNPIGPFQSEGEALLQLHHELSSCAQRTFVSQTRLARDPRKVPASEVAEGVKDPAKFVKERKIGFPRRNILPMRRLSWWFNTSLEQWAILEEAGIQIPRLRQGVVKGPSCK